MCPLKQKQKHMLFPKAEGPDNDNSNAVLMEMVLCINPASYENLSFAAEEKTASELLT